MKKRTLALVLAFVLLAALISGCGASSSAKSEAYDAGWNAAAEAPAAPMPEPQDAEMAVSEESGLSSANTSTATGGENPGDYSDYAEKIIYSADAQVETLKFDETVEAVYAMVERCGGFIEDSYVSGSDYRTSYYGYDTYRDASFTMRIPSARFEEVTNSLSTLGNVPYLRTYTENVTVSYYDTQSRLTAYEAQQARLLELLDIAETVEDILLIQAQLTEVQYEIDSLQTTLRIYDRQVAYSTIYLSINEVQEYTEEPVVVLTYWEKMTNGFVRSLRNVGEFFADLFQWIIMKLPVLIVIAIVLVVAIILIRRWHIKLLERRGEPTMTRAERREARRQRAADKKAARRARKPGGTAE